MAPPVVRRGLSVEFDDIRGVINAANAPFETLVPGDFFRSYLTSALDVRGRVDVGTILVVEQSDCVVGTVTYFDDVNDEGMPATFPARTAGLRATAVHPDAQGQGIGRALVEACAERARRRGAAAIALHTAPFMLSAIALYERAGFVRHEAYDFPATAFFRGAPRADLLAMAFIRDLT